MKNDEDPRFTIKLELFIMTKEYANALYADWTIQRPIERFMQARKELEHLTKQLELTTIM